MTPAEITKLQQQVQDLQERVDELEAGLHIGRLNEYRALGLASSQAQILALLMKRDFVSRQAIYTALYGNRIDDAPQPKIIDVWISRLRTKLGIQIATTSSAYKSFGDLSSGGYSIDASSKAKIRNLLNSKQGLAA